MDEQNAKTAFVRELRKVLPDLYNPATVRRSLLLELFGIEGRRDAPARLQRLVADAIDALAPTRDAPPGASAWRIHQVLRARYIDQFSQDETARDMFLSARQVRRQEHIAAEVLADYLWHTHHLNLRASVLTAADQGDATEHEELAGPSGRNEELAWLERTTPSETADFDELIRLTLKTARPLLDALQVAVTYEPASDLPALTVQPVAVRQALLHLITTAAHCAPRGRVSIRASASPRNLYAQVLISAEPCGPASEPLPSAEGLELARRIIELSRGALQATISADQPTAFSANITLPTAEQLPVLVIDDNWDTLRLLERYLVGSRYRFTGIGDPREALAVARQTSPSAIVLDIMLPEVDGWDLLGRLREHPQTREIPVIVCTILPQAQLAAMLGAAEFIAKPVRREALLTALDRLVGGAGYTSVTDDRAGPTRV